MYLVFFHNREDYQKQSLDRERMEEIFHNLMDHASQETVCTEETSGKKAVAEITESEEPKLASTAESSEGSGCEIQESTQSDITAAEPVSESDPETKAVAELTEASTGETESFEAVETQQGTKQNEPSETEMSTQVEKHSEEMTETSFGTELLTEAVTQPSTEERTPEIKSLEEYLIANNIPFEKPEGTSGFLDCVLSFPELGMLRGVYGGYDWMDIHHNLNDLYYLTTTASRAEDACPQLGSTAYMIQGHNSLRTDLAMNPLWNVRLGMTFELYGAYGIYHYTVTEVYGMNRTRSHTDLMQRVKELPKENCYLITCGRNMGGYRFRYQNMIVVGTCNGFTSYDERGVK